MQKSKELKYLLKEIENLRTASLLQVRRARWFMINIFLVHLFKGLFKKCFSVISLHSGRVGVLLSSDLKG